MKNIINVFIALFLFSSCVSTKKYNELNALSDKYFSEKKSCEADLAKTESNLDDCLDEKAKLQKSKEELQNELLQLGLSNSQLNKEIANYKNLNENLNKDKAALLEEANKAQNKLMNELTQKEKDLNKISEEQKALDALLKARQAEMDALQSDLNAKAKRIQDLEDKLSAKDLALQKLKDNIKSALQGFSSDEIQVEEKNGKLYVSLSEKLLFKSGSFAVDDKGKDALVKLASVLKEQVDFDIIVEGHTDNVPYSGTGQLSDNWDLSVKRATSVVRILTIQGGVSSDKIAASGRGEYVPISENESKEGKAKNRRTEIVLSPKLDKIMDLLNQ